MGRFRWHYSWWWLGCAFTSLLPPVVSSFLAGVSFAGSVFVLCLLSGLRLTFSTWGQIQPQLSTVLILWQQNKQEMALIYLFIPPLPPLLCRHGWSCACCIWVKVFVKLLAQILEDAHVHHENTTGSMHGNITWVTDLLSHLARDLVADRHDAAVGQLQHTDHLTAHHIQGHLGHHGDSSCWGVCQTVAHWEGRENKDTAGFKVKVLKITDKEALPWERNGSVLDTSKQSTTVSPCDRERSSEFHVSMLSWVIS